MQCGPAVRSAHTDALNVDGFAAARLRAPLTLNGGRSARMTKAMAMATKHARALMLSKPPNAAVQRAATGAEGGC
jgi:ABC-type uncharacterized transport system YnjBCD ATPase subunit